MSTTIDPTNANIVFSPYNWAVTTGYARTVNSGAYFRTIFSGTSVSLLTDTSLNSSPFSQLWIRVDNQGWQLFSLSAGNPTLAIASGLASGRKHMLEVLVKSTSQDLDRWTPFAGGADKTIVQITGIVLDTGASLLAPTRRSKNAIIFGDSITEGVGAYGNTGGQDVDRYDTLGSYAYALTTLLDAEIGIVGFGGSGLIQPGQANVPSFPNTYNLIYAGAGRSFTSPAPDLVIYNEGTNDTGNITSAFVSIVNAIRTYAPDSKHVLMVPFNQSHASEIAAVVSTINSPNVTALATAGFFDSAQAADGTHPYNYEGAWVLGPKVAPGILAVLYPSSGGAPSTTIKAFSFASA